MSTISLVVSAYNEEENLASCLSSAQSVVDEIIVVDNSSTDKTAEIARTFTKNVLTRKNNPMLNVNKNFGIEKSTSDWVLLLDADERLTDELQKEIAEFKELAHSESAFSMPRKNIIFGKWIEHTGWYPDRQVRLFKKGKGKFAEKHVHEMISVKGTIGELDGQIYHLNYTSLSQFLDKMIRIYTVNEAQNLIDSGYSFAMRDALIRPTKEFVKRFFAEKGYKDGSHGLALSLLMACYHLVVVLRVWEQKSYVDEPRMLQVFSEASKESARHIRHWSMVARIDEEKSPVRRIIRRVTHRRR